MAKPVLIIGSGLAGVTVARELRKLEGALPITLVCADAGDFYSKPMLSNALAAGKSAEQLVVTPREALAAQLQVEIRAHTRVLALHPDQHRVDTDAGAIDYGRLVLAVGAQPLRLPLEGDGAGDVLAVNSLADYGRFRERLAGRRRVALLGAGLIGCEFANDLAGAGYGVDVFDIAPQPLGRLLPAAAAAFFRSRLERLGIRFHFGSSIGRVERHGESFVLRVSGGDRFDADLVLSAIGLAPELALARAAGLVVNRGIVVDGRLATSAVDVHALGDCAEVLGLNLPFVMPLMQQARALAKVLAGQAVEVAYPAMPVVVKTPACPAVVSPPPAGSRGQWREEAAGEGIRAVYEDAAGRPLGFALVGAAVAEKQSLASRMPPWL